MSGRVKKRECPFYERVYGGERLRAVKMEYFIQTIFPLLHICRRRRRLLAWNI